MNMRNLYILIIFCSFFSFIGCRKPRNVYEEIDYRANVQHIDTLCDHIFYSSSANVSLCEYHYELSLPCYAIYSPYYDNSLNCDGLNHRVREFLTSTGFQGYIIDAMNGDLHELYTFDENANLHKLFWCDSIMNLKPVYHRFDSSIVHFPNMPIDKARHVIFTPLSSLGLEGISYEAFLKRFGEPSEQLLFVGCLGQNIDSMVVESEHYRCEFDYPFKDRETEELMFSNGQSEDMLIESFWCLMNIIVEWETPQLPFPKLQVLFGIKDGRLVSTIGYNYKEKDKKAVSEQSDVESGNIGYELVRARH